MVTDVHYLKMKFSAYKAAMLATAIERSNEDPSKVQNKNWQDEIEKVGTYSFAKVRLCWILQILTRINRFLHEAPQEMMSIVYRYVILGAIALLKLACQLQNLFFFLHLEGRKF